VKLVHLVGLIIKKFVTMHGHMNVKNKNPPKYLSTAFKETENRNLKRFTLLFGN